MRRSFRAVEPRVARGAFIVARKLRPAELAELRRSAASYRRLAEAHRSASKVLFS